MTMRNHEVAYTFRGGPLSGRKRSYRKRIDWVTASGAPASGPTSEAWPERRYVADHVARTYQWQPPASDARYRYEGGPLDGYSFTAGRGAPATRYRTVLGCPIEGKSPGLVRYYQLHLATCTYRPVTS